MVEQGIRLAQIDPNMLTSTKFEHAYRQTVTEDHVSNELQDLMVRYRLPRTSHTDFSLRPNLGSLFLADSYVKSFAPL